MSNLDYKLFYRCRLPHWQPRNVPIFLTWRLAGSLPRHVLEALASERELLQKDPRWKDANTDWQVAQRKRLFAKWDDGLHRGDAGPQWLALPEIAECVQQVLHELGQKFFTLHAYTLMPNHVHVLLTPGEEAESETPYSLGMISQRIKGNSARQVNLLLERTGQPFWSRESYDHWMRTPQEFERVLAYTLNNPIHAGLVTDWDAWRWHWLSEDLLV